MALSYKFVIKLSSSQELIRQMATYVDYVDKSYMPSSFAHQMGIPRTKTVLLFANSERLPEYTS